MSGRHVRTISLRQELDQFVASHVASGQYSTANEGVRAGQRTLVGHQMPNASDMRSSR